MFISAPLYYAILGRFGEFWSSYWTYNVYQNVATGRSLANQLVYGRDVALRYYRAWPISFLIVTAFIVITASLWRAMSRHERFVHLSLSVWFVGAWAELMAGQRYSSHYFSILALPTALMAATVIGHVYRLIAATRGEFRTAVAWPLIGSLLAIAAGGGAHLTMGLEAASSYSSVHHTAETRAATQPGTQRTVRAVLDLVSRPNDPLLAWTDYPWTYLQYHRVAATRWIWKSFMLGQIYLGRSSLDYVLPRTWEWFADDMAEAHPAVFLEETALPLTDGTPFATYVHNGFEEAYAGTDNNIYLRRDAADDILRAASGASFTPTSRVSATTTKWTMHSGSATLAADTPPSYTDVLALSDSLCTRISGTYATTPGTSGSFLSFRFDNADGSAPNMRLNIVDTQIFSGDDGAIFDTTYLGSPVELSIPGGDSTGNTALDPHAGGAATDPASADVTTTGAPTADQVAESTTHTFAVVAGRESAALVIDGMIHAAVRLTDQNRLSLEVRNGGVVLGDLHRGEAPPNSGCG